MQRWNLSYDISAHFSIVTEFNDVLFIIKPCNLRKRLKLLSSRDVDSTRAYVPQLPSYKVNWKANNTNAVPSYSNGKVVNCSSTCTCSFIRQTMSSRESWFTVTPAQGKIWLHGLQSTFPIVCFTACLTSLILQK